MKNKNLFVFILSAIVIVTGLFSTSVLDGFKNVVKAFFTERQTVGVFNAFDNLTDKVEKTVISNLTYHDSAVDAYSLFNRAINTLVVEKDDMTVVRAENGYLGGIRAKVEEDTLKAYAENVNELYKSAENSGAEFLYVMAPTKGYDFLYPPNITDYTAENCDSFIKELKARNIPYFSLIERAEKEGITGEEMFFVTDHHWKPEWGLWGAAKISEYFEKEFDFEYDKAILDIENYNVKNYEDWFLGSQGKKTGTYFTKYGADDFKIITPKFETNLTESQPLKNSVREGKFQDTVLYLGNAGVKDYYNVNSYATYSGGDFREQIITNNLNKEGKKLLIVRDSFACALVPFLSLTMGETYAVDVRDNAGYVGEKIKVSEYIEKVKPDYVMVFYTGLTANDSLYNFE